MPVPPRYLLNHLKIEGFTMETLPPEMVEKVCRYLTPRDLARCCVVSRSWREIFNQDRLWKPHCDPALEEPLRTIPSVVEPVFVTPGGEDSILAPVSHWRLAFMQEQHLWGNLKNKIFRHEYFSSTDFRSLLALLSETLIVHYNWDTIEVWDLGVIPPALVVKTAVTVNALSLFCRSMAGNSVVILKENVSIKVFQVDVFDRSIKLKHDIPVANTCQCYDSSWETFIVQEQMSGDESTLLGVCSIGSGLIIFDLEKGEKIKEDRGPIMENELGDRHIIGMKYSPTSDGILVLIQNGDSVLPFIYSLKQQLYLPGPISKTALPCLPNSNLIAINKHYVALGGMPSMTIIDYHTSEVLFKYEGQEYDARPLAYKDSFIFLDFRQGKLWLKTFSLTNKSITTTIVEWPCRSVKSHFSYLELRIVNDNYVILYDCIYHEASIAAFDLSGSLKVVANHTYHMLPRCADINKTFTRSCLAEYREECLHVHYYW